MILNELIDVPILYLSSYIIANKPEYYRLLNQTNWIEKWEEWIMFMLKAVESASKDTITRITNIKDLLDSTIINVQEKASKVYRKELVELLFEKPYSKIEYWKNEILKGYKTIKLTTLSLGISDTIAVEKGKWKIAWSSGPEMNGMYLTEWRFSNNQWKKENDISGITTMNKETE